MTHRPAGLLSTEMSKKVRFLTTMVADGKRLEDGRLRACRSALVVQIPREDPRLWFVREKSSEYI